MNPLQAVALHDVQAELDDRDIAIDHVGIEDLDYPITLTDRDHARQSTIAKASLGVALPAHLRGTHMSRFVQTLHTYRDEISAEILPTLLCDLLQSLDALTGEVSLRFPVFLSRTAPASGLASLMGYEGHLRVSFEQQKFVTSVGVRVAVTSLCPCSKEISDYGAHNQRGYVEVSATANKSLNDRAPMPWLADLIDVAETSASAPLYPLLKRVDERHVTMQAYDNPAFVEDIVRNAAVALRDDKRIDAFEVKATNQESIHNHSAVARVRWSRAA